MQTGMHQIPVSRFVFESWIKTTAAESEDGTDTNANMTVAEMRLLMKTMADAQPR